MVLSLDEVDSLGTIRAEDLRRLAQASPRVKRFLDESVYNPATGGYTRNGEAVPYAEIQALLEFEQQRLNLRFEDATTSYLDGETTLEEWERKVAGESKTAFVIITLLVFGGLALLSRNPQSRQIWKQTGETLREHLRGVNGFSMHVESGDRSAKQLQAYVGYKARGIRPLYAKLRKQAAISAGFTEARRFLDPSSQHCPQCPGYERFEWVPIDEIVPVGEACDCQGRCRCRVQYR